MINKKVIKPIIIGLIVFFLISLGLFYYQKQGLIKIFPTKEEIQLKKILTIDESKLKSPNGLSQKDFDEKLAELKKQRQLALKDLNDSNAWFSFAFWKEFFNDHEGAAAAWEVAYQLQPNDFRTSLNLGNVYQYFLKNYPQSEFYYLKLLELQPSYTSGYDGLMDLYRFNWKEESDKYEPLVLQAIEKDSANQKAYYVNLVEFFASPDNLDLVKAESYLALVKKFDSAAAAELIIDYPQLKK